MPQGDLWTQYVTALDHQIRTLRQYVQDHPFTSSWSELKQHTALLHLQAIEQGYQQQQYPLEHLEALSNLTHDMNLSSGTVVRATLEALGAWVQDASKT